MAKPPSGFNAVLATKNFGSRKVRVGTINYGIDIIAQQDEAANRQAFYPSAYDSSSFALTLLFVSWEERERFNAWLRTYMEKTIRGRGFFAAMTVYCPARDFTRVGVPQSTLEYGEGLTDVGYITTLNFLGVTDPVDPTKNALTQSYFKWPKRDKQSKYFYPAGLQVSGAASMEGSIYDTNPVIVPDLPTTGGTQDDVLPPI